MNTNNSSEPPPVNLSEAGGIAVVVLASGFDMPTDFGYHPQIVPLLAGDLPEDWGQLSGKIPSTTKLVLIGGELPARQFGSLRTVLSRRNLTFVHRRNAVALRDALAKVLPGKPHVVVDADAPVNGNGHDDGGVPVDDPPGVRTRGAVTELASQADLAKGSAEEARRLFRVAQQRGIVTTVASLAQAISKLKRQGGRTETPRSVMSAQQRALVTLDEAIAALQLIREYVSDTEAMNHELRRKLDAFKAILDKA